MPPRARERSSGKPGGFVRFIEPGGVVLGVEIGLGTGAAGESGKGASEGRANAGLRHDGAVGNAGAKPKPVKCHDDCIGGFAGVTATYGLVSSVEYIPVE